MQKALIIGGIIIVFFGLFVFVDSFNFGIFRERQHDPSIKDWSHSSGGPPDNGSNAQEYFTGLFIMSIGLCVFVTGLMLTFLKNPTRSLR